ncbi:MAG: FtsX-like permease family protein [Arcicella sp.]|nr:FtsX-like permease family protein [Arcicella sp.]
MSFIGILLVVIACINFINLSTAQSFKKYKEIGVRKALGSSQKQIFWQFMAETALVVLIAFFIAILAANLLIPTMNQWLKIAITPYQFFDVNLLMFIALAFIFIVFMAGFYPSLIISKFNPVKALKGITNEINQGIFVRKSLVITQFCVSFVLIAVSILVVLQINFMENKDIGSNKDLVLHVKIPYAENDFWNSLKNQILQKPFVKNISFSNVAPSAEIGNGGQVKFENRADWEKFAVRSKIADENYLDTYQLKLVTGRKPIASDTIREILVNKKLVADLGLKSPEEAINKHLFIGDGGKIGTIVGVLADFNNTNLYTNIEPTVVFSSRNRYKQAAIKLNTFDAKNTINELRKIWESTFPNEVFEYSFYDQELALFYEKEDLVRSLCISFALLSIFISCLGLFGLANFTAQQRTKEIGIRKVLGASVNQIVQLLSKDFLKLVIISIIIASPIAYYFMQKWLQDFAYRIEISWWIFVMAGVVALLIALLTVSYQAIRAALANPVKSLRTA